MGTQRKQRVSAWVRRRDEGAARGYAEATKVNCVGTQCDGVSGACFLVKYAARQSFWVRTCCDSTRRDISTGCVPYALYAAR